MSSGERSTPKQIFGAEAALDAYWRTYEADASAIVDEVRAATSGESVDWSLIIGSLAAAPTGEGSWATYLASLRTRGIELAHAGVSYSAWLEVMAIFRDVVRTRLASLARDDLAGAALASRGLDRFLDVVLANIGEAYIAAKEQLVAHTKEHYQKIFARSPLPMCTYDRATLRFVSVNEAALRHYGYTHDEFAAMTLAEIHVEEDLALLRETVASAHGTAPARLWTHRKKDGTLIKVEVSADDIVDEGRKLRLVLVNDVTQRELANEKLRKTEEQLHHAQKMEAVGRLAGGVAHDFNNVLTVIESYASLLEEAHDLADPRREDIVEIRLAAQRASAITRQLLTVSRHSIASPRAVQLDEIVGRSASMLRRLVGEQITIVTRPGAVPPVIADAGRLEQVLLNLAVNARDAMPDGGRLVIETYVTELDGEEASVRALKGGRYVVLAVTDTGLGMDAETQTRIFDPFFTTKPVGEGTGLGLSIVHGIVSQAGGAVAVYSEMGHGTTFRVYLPVANGDETTAAPPTIAGGAPSERLPNATVLVVDDDDQVRQVAARILTAAGCRVLEASTAEEATRVCVRHPGALDVLLLDVVLRDGRSDVLLPDLRALRPNVVAVLMSGYPAGVLMPGGSAPALLEKPFSPAALRAAIAQALERTESAAASHRTTTAGSEVALRPRVLVADDDDVYRRTIARGLKRAGFDIVEAPDGAAAIAMLEADRFDAVLSDVHMPRMTGLELIRSVRRVDLDLPVLLVSGSPDVASASEALEYGAFRYLTKLVDVNALAHLLSQAARAHALARLRREALLLGGGSARPVDRAGLEVRFNQAFEQLWLAAQPIVHAGSGALFGNEVLVRSREPSMASPLALLEAATELGVLPRVGRKVRALAAALLAARSDSALLFVNLHPEDLFDVELVDEKSPLTQVAPRIVLEITERAALTASAELGARIARLRALGFRIAVDDIGAGYSGLQSFAELAPEIVKIDMSLVRNVHESPLKQRTIAALCRLCQESGCLVVGEGVETLDERACLTSLGCDLLQGYLIGRPA